METNDFRIDVPDFDGTPEKPLREPPLSDTGVPVPPTFEPEPPLFETEEPHSTTESEHEQPASEPEDKPTSAPEPAPEPAAATPDLSVIEAKLDALMEKFDTRLAADSHKDALFDKMYAELATYKTDIYAKLLKPLILSVSSMLDEANAFIERARTEEPDPARMKKYISNIALDLEEMLEVNGVDIYSEETETFNPSTQRVVGQVPTDDPAADNRIADRRRKGYRWNGVILRPEMVTIYKFKN